MLTRRLVLAAIVLVASSDGFARGVEGVACQPGGVTTLVAKSCANVWPVESPKFRWPDLREACDSSDRLCSVLQYKSPLSLRVQDCVSVRILEIFAEDRLARISCAGGLFPDRLINLDALACGGSGVSEVSGVGPGSGVFGPGIVDRAESIMRRVSDDVASDTAVLLGAAEGIGAERLRRLFSAAHVRFVFLLERVRAREKLDSVCEPLEGRVLRNGNEIRAQKSCRVLMVSVDMGAVLLRSRSEDLLGAVRAGMGVGSGAGAVAGVGVSATNALAVRMLLFHALDGEVPGLRGRLRLIRKGVETGVPDFWELHSGFIFGGHRLGANSGNGYDCSEFVAAALGFTGDEIDLLTTKNLKNIWRYLSGESSLVRLSRDMRRLSKYFAAVDLRRGDRLLPGDVVVSNSHIFGNQHVAFIKRVLPDNTFVTLEAAGGLINAIMSKTRPIYEPVPICYESEKYRPFRPDIYILRYIGGKP